MRKVFFRFETILQLFAHHKKKPIDIRGSCSFDEWSRGNKIFPHGTWNSFQILKWLHTHTHIFILYGGFFAMFLLDMIQNCSILFSKDHLKHPIGQPNEALEIQTCTVFPYGYGYGSNAIHSNQIIRFHWWIWMEALYNQYISSDGIHWFLGKGDKFEVAQKKPLPIGRLMWKLMKFIHFSKCYWSTHDIRWICSLTPIYICYIPAKSWEYFA